MIFRISLGNGDFFSVGNI